MLRHEYQWSHNAGKALHSENYITHTTNRFRYMCFCESPRTSFGMICSLFSKCNKMASIYNVLLHCKFCVFLGARTCGDAINRCIDIFFFSFNIAERGDILWGDFSFKVHLAQWFYDCSQCIFTVSLFSPFGMNASLLCAKFVWYWSCGFGKEFSF